MCKRLEAYTEMVRGKDAKGSAEKMQRVTGTGVEGAERYTVFSQ